MSIPLETSKGAVLDVPILDSSPLAFELEVSQTIPLNDSEVYICRIRNVQVDEELSGENRSVEERIQAIAPVRTTCQTYFSWTGKAFGKWGELMQQRKP